MNNNCISNKEILEMVTDKEDNKTVYQIIYVDKDGNFHDTNIEYKNKELGLKGLELEVGNCKELDMMYIQLYKSIYNSNDERVSTELIAEKEITK